MQITLAKVARLGAYATTSAILIITSACTSSSVSGSKATPTPSVPGGRLYGVSGLLNLPVPPPSYIAVFQGPFSAASTAVGRIDIGVGGVAVDPTDPTGAVYVSSGSQILKFPRPNPNGATPALTFSSASLGSISFDTNGDLLGLGTNALGPLANDVYIVRHPITSSSVTEALIVGSFQVGCVALDAGNNLYVLTATRLQAYAPPYTGAPISTSAPGARECAYNAALNSLFIVSANNGWSVASYALPLTANELPSFAVEIKGLASVGDLVFDSSGDSFLFISNDPLFTSGSIAVATPPFTGQATFTFPTTFMGQLATGP